MNYVGIDHHRQYSQMTLMDQEGQVLRCGTIVRAGNLWLRWAAVEAVWPGIRADFDLRCFYERLARNKGANKAKVATARRLLTIIYKVLKEGRNYIAYRS